MSRIKFKNGNQKTFLNKIHQKGFLGWATVAKICNVSERTIRDWRKEKFNMKYEAAQALSKKTKVPLSCVKQILPDFWSVKKAASLGGKRRYEIYGNPGTANGRKKGGINSQRKFRNNPEYAEKLGIKIRKLIREPRNSPALAEFIGIMLGDGGMTDYQARITLNSETDRKYSFYVQKLIKKLFNIESSRLMRKFREEKAVDILISSKSLINFLLKKDLKTGHKINNNIDIPKWIKSKSEYKIACLRGLMDTDGSFYLYKHKVNGKIYNNFAICFTSYSNLLLNSACKILKELDFRPSGTKKRIYLHRKKDIRNYINRIGSNNPKHLAKYKTERYGSGHNRTVSKIV